MGVTKMLDNHNAAEILEWGRYRDLLVHYYLIDDADNFNKLNDWRKTMASRVFTIELKMDLDIDDEKFEPMKLILARTAHDLRASAILLTANGKKPPEAVAFTEDQFFNVDNIVLFDDEGNPITSGGNEAADANAP
jgi:hypothetical protein